MNDVSRRELLGLIAAALVYRSPAAEQPLLIEYWLVAFDESMKVENYGDALESLRELRLAIEAEGVPGKWTSAYQAICGV